MEKQRINTKTITYIILIVCGVILGFISWIYLSLGFHDYERIKLVGVSSSNLDYKVYLKDNPFFKEKYLGKDKLYIVTLIDYVDVNFNYILNFNKKMDGECTYYIKGTIMANKNSTNFGDNTNYWEKEYKLTEPQTINYKNKRSVSLSQNIKFDYQKYNEILKKFKKEYSLLADGNFKLELVVNSKSKNDNFEEEMKIDSFVSLDMPLSEKTIEKYFIEKNNDKNYSMEVDYKLDNTKYKIYKCIGFLFAGLSLIIIIRLITDIINNHKLINKYNQKVEKILKNYDDIIVSLDRAPCLSNLKIVQVSTFEELLDAHNEIRMPISHFEIKKDFANVFILINDNIAWVYTLLNVPDKK